MEHCEQWYKSLDSATVTRVFGLFVGVVSRAQYGAHADGHGVSLSPMNVRSPRSLHIAVSPGARRDSAPTCSALSVCHRHRLSSRRRTIQYVPGSNGTTKMCCWLGTSGPLFTRYTVTVEHDSRRYLT